MVVMIRSNGKDLLFDVLTPLGFRVRVSRSYWNMITDFKHPAMKGHEKEVKNALGNPDEIRRSKSDANVYLFYKYQHKERWVCAVSRRLNGGGFLITAYPTDTIKAGEKIWPK